MNLQIIGVGSQTPGISADPASASLTPGTEQDITISFIRNEIGAFSGVLTILSNDPHNPALEIALEAEVIPNLPYISVNPHYLDFGNCFIGDSRSLQIVVTNPGPQDLHISDVILPHTDFSFSPSELSIAYQQSAVLSISFTPLIEASFNSALQIVSNAANEPILQIPVYATAVYPPQITITPQSISSSAESGGTGNAELYIGNSGGSPLTWAIDENMGKALRLRGYSVPNTQFVRIPNRSEIQLVGGSFSLSLWFKVDSNLGGTASGSSVNGGRQYIFSKSETTKPGFLGVYCDGFATSETGKRLVLQARNSSGLQSISLNGAVTLNNWYHMALSYSDNELRIYLNGENMGSLSLAGYNGNTDDWVLGKYEAENNRKYLLEGSLDEFVIYRSARPVETIRHRMFTKVNPYEQNLGGYWNWDAGNGMDSSIYHTTASLRGAPTFPVSTVSATPKWVSLAPAWALSEANSGLNVQLHLDASDFLAGTYHANLKLRSNDYTQSLINLPLEFNVSGNAGITLSNSSLDFAEVIINTTKQKQLTISNNGSAELILNDIITSNPSFSIPVNTLSLAPGESYDLPVSFSPTAVDNYSGILSFSGNLEDEAQFEIPLSGAGALPPLMSYSPESLSLNLDYGTITNATVNISNAQGLPLSYQATLLDNSRSNVDGIYPGLNTGSRGMTWLNGKLYFVSQSSNQLKRYNPETQTIDAEWTIHNNPYSITSDGTAFYIGSTSGRIYKYNSNLVAVMNFLNPMVNYPATVVYANSSLYVMDVNNNNKPIYRFNTNGNFLELFNTVLSRSSQIIHVPEHTAAPFYALQSGLQRLVSFKITSNEVQIVDTLSVAMGACYSLAHNGRDLYILQNDMDYMKRIDDGQAEFNWVSLSNRSGSIPAGTSTDLNIRFSALNSFAGQYNAQLKLVTNDPLHNPVLIPLSMQVIGIPRYSASAQSLDFGACYLGYPRTLQLMIENNGSAILQIENISSSGAFTVDQNSLNIAPWTAGMLNITYNPETLGEDSGTISFQTNDPQHAQVQISLSGECLEAPNIAVNPTQVNVNLMNDASTVVPIQIQNTGLTELNYQLQINLEGSRSSTNTRLPGDILSSMPFPYSTSGAIVLNNQLFAVRNNSTDLLCFDLEAQNVIAEYMIHDSPYGIAWNGSSFVIGGEGGILYFYYPEDLSISVRSLPHRTMSTNIGSFPAFTFDGTDIIVASAFSSSPTSFRRFDANGMLKSVHYLNQSNLSALHRIPQYTDTAIYAYQNVIVGGVPSGGKILKLNVGESGVALVSSHAAWDNALTYTLCHDGNDFLVADFDGPLLRVDDGSWLGSTISYGTILADQSSHIPLKLDPSGMNGGNYSATLKISSNDPDSPIQNIPVSLALTGYPGISLNPQSAVFDSTLIGQSRIMELVVHNPGTDILQVSHIEFSSPDFTISNSSFSIAPKATRILTITFSPAAHGQISAEMTISSNAHGNPELTYNVLGFGKTPEPGLTITPAVYNYLGVYTNAYASKNFKLKNSGTAVLNISSYTCAEASFTSSAIFPLSIAPGDSLYIPVRFSPTLAQEYAAAFVLNSNLATDKHIALSGTGLTPLPHLDVSPSPINMGNVIVTVPKVSQLTLNNTGQLPLLISSISSQNPALAITGIPASIAAGSSAQLNLQYTASVSGNFSGMIEVISNDPDTPNLEIPYSGTAILGSPIIGSNTNSLNFPLTLVGSQSSQNLIITNSGNLPLSINRIEFSHNAFSTQIFDIQILPQGTAILPVTYAPTQAGAASGFMLLRNNSLNANYQVALQGTAEHPVFYTVNPEYLDISSMQAETLSSGFTISNTGNGTLNWNLQNDAPWLSLSPSSGILNAGNSVQVNLTISTHDLLYDQYIAYLELNSNSQSTPQRIIPVYLLFAEYGYTTTDNEDNLGTGNPDGDMDVLVTHNSALAPIEFNIFLDETQISNAQLRILAKSLKPNSQHKVYVNNYLVGYLATPNTEMQISNFNVNPAWLDADSQTPNTVRIVHDTTVPDPDGIMIMWGSITCNRNFTNAHISQLIYEPQMPVPASQLSLTQSIETDLYTQIVRVVSRLKDATGTQMLNTHTRQMELHAYQPANTNVIWNIPPELTPGHYYAEVEVYDANSNFLQDSTQLPISILANVPLITAGAQSLDFGDLYPGYGSQKNLVLTNLGAATLQVRSLNFSSPRFSSSISQFSIPSGGSYELPVFANLNAVGPINAMLSVSSNDPENPTIAVNLSANGISAPQISVSANQIFFEMDQYAVIEQQVNISNTGLGNLIIDEIEVLGLDWVQTQVPDTTLDPAEQTQMILSFNSTGLQDGLYFGQLLIHSNDPAQPTTEIELQITLSPRSLIAEFSAEPITGYAPLLVNFVSESYTTDGSQIVVWEWDFDGDGVIDSSLENPSFTYLGAGNYTVSLNVTNDTSQNHQTTKHNFVFVLNSAPEVAQPLPDFELHEDTPLLGFDLTPYFSDPDGDELWFSVSPHPQLIFQHDGPLLSIYPAQDYYGSGQIVITALDPHSASTSQTVWVHVLAVNDPPQFDDLPPVVEFLRYTDYTVDFAPFVSDPDTDLDLITISITGNTNFIWSATGLAVTFSAPGDWFGEETVIISLNDNFGRSITTAELTVRILAGLSASFSTSHTDVLAGVPVEFQNTSPGNITHFEWDFDNDSIVDSEEMHPVHVYALGGFKSPRLRIMHKIQEDIIHQDEFVFTDGIFVRGTNIPGGNAVGSWILENAPYNITGPITIPSDSTLSIDPEVQINIINAEVSITVHGSLQADSVNFRPLSTDRWKGFVVPSDVDNMLISNSTIKDAETPFMLFGNATIQDCVISKDSLMVFSDEYGIRIAGAASPTIQNVEILNYNTGIEIAAEFAASAPTISNIRVKNSSNTLRNNSVGIYLSGKVLPDFQGVDIEDYPIGLSYTGDGSTLAAPPTLSNIRVRNTSNTVRNNTIGIKLRNLERVIVTQDSIFNYDTAIDFENENPELANRPTISNIRVRNTSNTVRVENTGIKLKGNLQVRLFDIDIDEYHHGISVIGLNNSTLAAPSTISNIRVRNTANTVRNTGIGIYIQDIPRITVSNNSLEGYYQGIAIHNSNQMYAAKPTLSNIRVRNTSNTVRNVGTGILLSPGIDAEITDCLIQEYAHGIHALGSTLRMSKNRLLNNDIAVFIENGGPGSYMEYNELAKEHPTMQNPIPAIKVHSSQDVSVINNTIFNYSQALAATSSAVNFTNNIAWAENQLDDVFYAIASSLNISYSNTRTPQAYPGEGNLNIDPLFLDESELNFALHHDSPMIDAGDPTLPADPDDSIRDIGANIYLHNAEFVSDLRFVSLDQAIQFTNQSLGHPADISTFAWDFDNDGQIDSTLEHPSWIPPGLGRYDVKLVIQTGTLVDSLLLRNHILVQNVILMPPANLRLNLSQSDITLVWDPVQTDIYGEPASPNFYICYANNLPSGTFRYIGETEGATSFTHPDAAQHERMFYTVIGFAGTRAQLRTFLNSRGNTIYIAPRQDPITPQFKTDRKASKTSTP
jgi:PKD repeat protein